MWCSICSLTGDASSWDLDTKGKDRQRKGWIQHWQSLEVQKFKSQEYERYTTPQACTHHHRIKSIFSNLMCQSLKCIFFLLHFVNTNVIHLHPWCSPIPSLLVLIALPVAPGNEFITPQTSVFCVCIVCWDLVSLQTYLEIKFTYFCVWKLNLVRMISCLQKTNGSVKTKILILNIVVSWRDRGSLIVLWQLQWGDQDFPQPNPLKARILYYYT